MSYTEQVLNEPLRGQAKEQQEQARSQRILLEDTRNTVVARTAAAYLELGMVRHSLDLLRKEQASAEKILEVTQGREKENLELPVEVTRSQLTKVRVVQRILQLEAREDELEVFLRSQTGLGQDTPIEVSPEELPGEAEQEGANLVAMAMQSNTSLLAGEADVRAKEFRLVGEKRGYYPTLELVSVYSVLGKFNNYDQFFKTFQRNNVNAGVQVQVPLFSAQTKASIALAQVNLDVAKANLANKKNEVSAAVRQKTRHVRGETPPRKWRASSCNSPSRTSPCCNRSSRKAKSICARSSALASRKTKSGWPTSTRIFSASKPSSICCKLRANSTKSGSSETSDW